MNFVTKGNYSEVPYIRSRISFGLICVIVSFFVVPIQLIQAASDFTPLTDFSKINRTVKVISHDRTVNGEIFAVAVGSATIISAAGLLITNNHVIEDDHQKPLAALAICVTTNNNEEPRCEYTATLVARSREKDLALLKIDSQDIRGNTVANLPYYDAFQASEPEVSDSITAIGYPDIGGNTITTTKGVISGFTTTAKDDDVVYIKVDSTISAGNSGGTMIDNSNNFIGIPTQILESDVTSESLGFAIDLRSVRPWIQDHQNDPLITPNFNKELQPKRILLNDANNRNQLIYPYYPSFELSTDATWQFETVEKNTVALFAETSETQFAIEMAIERFPFDLNRSPYLKDILKDIEENKDDLLNYQRKSVIFADQIAELISYINHGHKEFIYVIPYGYALFQIRYGYELHNIDHDQEVYEKVLNTLKFLQPKQSLSPPAQFSHEEIGLDLSTSGNFRIQKTENYRDKENLLQFLLEDNFKGTISIWYQELEEYQKALSDETLLDKQVESNNFISEFTLITKDPAIFIDGLPGWSLTYSYRGDKYQETRRSSEIFFRDGEHYFFIDYDDLEDSYKANLEDFKKILKSLKIARNQEQKGRYKIGALDFIFTDIANHRFLGAISSLFDRGIMTGFPNKIFQPEELISRAQAIKVIIDSKLYNHDAALDKRAEVKAYSAPKYLKLSFSDHRQSDWFTKYLRYARDKKIIIGYPDGSFRPHQGITTAEALTILFRAHEIKTWQPPLSFLTTESDSSNPANDALANSTALTTSGNLTTTLLIDIPWYKGAMDKAFQLQILPPELFDSQHYLTRAEFAYIVDTLLKSKEEF